MKFEGTLNQIVILNIVNCVLFRMFINFLCADDESLKALEINTHSTKVRQSFQWELLKTYENTETMHNEFVLFDCLSM